MSIELWDKLPYRFVKIGHRRWCKLEHEVRLLIFDLATRQKFKCALCDEDRDLIIEHDHDPEIGSGGKKLTIYNIRGLVCSHCNRHLWIYEADARGDDRGWYNIDSSDHSADAYDDYIYYYDCRIDALRDKLLREQLPSRSYWRRKFVMNRLEEWEEWGADYPWYWGFDEIKDKKYGPIRTPRHFINTLGAVLRFYAEETKKNPDFEPPDSFIQLMVRLKPIFDELRPLYDARKAASRAQ